MCRCSRSQSAAWKPVIRSPVRSMTPGSGSKSSDSPGPQKSCRSLTCSPSISSTADPDLGREVQGVAHQLLAAQRHLPPPAVQTREDQHRRAGGAQQIRAHPQQRRRNQVTLQMEDGALFQTAAHLVDARHADVRARVHRPGRKIGMERQMRAPGLVHDQRPGTPVAHLGDRTEVRAAAVGRGARDQRTPCVRVGLEGPLEVLGGRGMGEVAFGVPARLDPDRLDTGDDQPRHHGLVRVASDQQLLVRPRGRQHGRLHRQGAAACAEERVLGVHRVGHQLLRPLQHPAPGQPVVKAARRQNVAVEHRVTEDLPDRRIGAAGLLVPRRRERQMPLAAVLVEGFQDRCSGVVDRHAAQGSRRVPSQCRRCPAPGNGPPWSALRAGAFPGSLSRPAP